MHFEGVLLESGTERNETKKLERIETRWMGLKTKKHNEAQEKGKQCRWDSIQPNSPKGEGTTLVAIQSSCNVSVGGLDGWKLFVRDRFMKRKSAMK